MIKFGFEQNGIYQTNPGVQFSSGLSDFSDMGLKIGAPSSDFTEKLCLSRHISACFTSKLEEVGDTFLTIPPRRKTGGQDGVRLPMPLNMGQRMMPAAVNFNSLEVGA